MKTITNIIYPAFALFAFACLALSPQARATCQEGCLTNDNSVLGDDALLNNTGTDNTAVGFNALYSNTTGGANTAIGSDALLNNTTANINTAIGADALSLNTTGGGNTASGAEALYSNTTGVDNTASGAGALFNNTTGEDNTVSGNSAAYFNTTGIGNTASGWSTLEFNTTGNNNTATGIAALLGNKTGSGNTADGAYALWGNTTGNRNVADGNDALFNNTTGGKNVADGNDALFNNTTGGKNVAVGDGAGRNLTTGDHNIDVGNEGVAAEANTIRIGMVGTQTATFIAGISGAIIPTGVAVIVDTTGHLGTTTSSARFKEAIRPMDNASEAILALKPVTFRYKKELDPKGISQFGLVAEQVEEVNPDLVAHDDQGKPYTVRYDAVNAMLLNEFLKEHRTVDEQAATIRRQRKDFETAIAQQQKQIEALTATVKEQAAQIQKVSAQLEVSRRAQQTVVINR